MMSKLDVFLHALAEIDVFRNVISNETKPEIIKALQLIGLKQDDTDLNKLADACVTLQNVPQNAATQRANAYSALSDLIEVLTGTNPGPVN